VESSPGITTLNGAPLPVGGVAAADGLPTRIAVISATTDKEAECFKGPPGSLGKAKPKLAQGQLGALNPNLSNGHRRVVCHSAGCKNKAHLIRCA